MITPTIKTLTLTFVLACFLCFSGTIQEQWLDIPPHKIELLHDQDHERATELLEVQQLEPPRSEKGNSRKL